MKIRWYYFIITLLIQSCDESEKGMTITDYKGISVELFWKGVEPKNRDGIGLTIYGPDGRLYFQGFDSLGFSYSYPQPNGKYTIQVEAWELKHQNYIISIQGLDGDFAHEFEGSFEPADDIGTSKTSLFLTTDRYSYTFETP